MKKLNLKDIVEATGVIIFAIGLMAADSACLLFPLGLPVAGYVIFKLSERM